MVTIIHKDTTADLSTLEFNNQVFKVIEVQAEAILDSIISLVNDTYSNSLVLADLIASIREDMYSHPSAQSIEVSLTDHLDLYEATQDYKLLVIRVLDQALDTLDNYIFKLL